MVTDPTLLTVSEITRQIKQRLESGFPLVSIQGEVSNFKRHTSGHLYFTLKDDAAQISAVMWRSRASFLSFVPEDGMKIIVNGRVTVYEVRGNYQVEVGSMRPLGVGELQLAFEYLKRKLAGEGLFDSDHKKPLPEFPERIGIITSPTGAALQDMLNVLRRRFPGVEVILRPVKVQGAGAPKDIANAIDELNAFAGVDLLIVARGGGSLEDLWAFNEEIVARAIYASRIPVVSAVGHEIDFTIADFVADLRAPTPSAAAELVVKDRMALLDIVRDNWYTLNDRLLEMLRYRKENILHLLKSYSFNKPIDLLRQFSQRVDELDRRMAGHMEHRLALIKASTDSIHRRALALDPNLVLKRGYTIVYKDERIVGSSKPLNPQDAIDIKFHDGVVRSTVS
jgi:exodeoxyribonuclease VII large subunit